MKLINIVIYANKNITKCKRDILYIYTSLQMYKSKHRITRNMKNKLAGIPQNSLIS